MEKKPVEITTNRRQEPDRRAVDKKPFEQPKLERHAELGKVTGFSF